MCLVCGADYNDVCSALRIARSPKQQVTTQIRFNLSFATLSPAGTRDLLEGRNKLAKEGAEVPRRGLVWHAHNMSAVERWLDAGETTGVST